MRTTVRLDDALLTAVKRLAVERGTTLTAVFEEALREKLAHAGALALNAAAPVLPTYRGKGPRAGIDLHDTSALLDLMDHADA
jgi:hypothetical protein